MTENDQPYRQWMQDHGWQEQPGAPPRWVNRSEGVFVTDTAARYWYSLVREAVQAAQQNAVAWTVGVVDDLHGTASDRASMVIDRTFKGVKNTIRDRFKAETAVDPAPNYPIKAKLVKPGQPQEGGDVRAS